MIWYLTVMLTYAELDESKLTKWQEHSFDDDQACHLFLTTNKVALVDSLLERFRNEEDNTLTSFEFYCQGETIILQEV
tara:strand:+ start:230 stop:463 length:234 start_codon:yes stop_codon:yes gene_type:complete